MQENSRTYRVGSAIITKIEELTIDAFSASQLFVQADQAVADEQAKNWGAGSIDPSTGNLRLGFHSWLLQTPTQTVLIDTGVGADKERPNLEIFGHLHETFLARLREVGVTPDDVDLVLHTHLHVDHVGWNTHNVGGQWVPTFPKATHVFSSREYDYVKSISEKSGRDTAMRNALQLGRMQVLPIVDFYADSLLPVILHGQGRMIEINGRQTLDGFAFHSTPGHSIDHASISFISEGEEAFFWGDVMHSPIQFAVPTWNSVFCEFPDAATRSRAWAVAHASASHVTVFTTHFAESSVGKVRTTPSGYTWEFMS